MNTEDRDRLLIEIHGKVHGQAIDIENIKENIGEIKQQWNITDKKISNCEEEVTKIKERHRINIWLLALLLSLPASALGLLELVRWIKE